MQVFRAQLYYLEQIIHIRLADICHPLGILLTYNHIVCVRSKTFAWS